MHVLPSGRQWQTHEDGFNPSIRSIEAKFGTSVLDEVEFNISSTAELLPIFLCHGKGHVLGSNQCEFYELVGGEYTFLFSIIGRYPGKKELKQSVTKLRSCSGSLSSRSSKNIPPIPLDSPRCLT